jgi:hypothetical protein
MSNACCARSEKPRIFVRNRALGWVFGVEMGFWLGIGRRTVRAEKGN